jgi:predicted N-acyltransferase
MVTENFVFKKRSKILGIVEGYYFKGEFLSRYKTEAIKILRNRVETAGSKIGDKSKLDIEKGKEICKDEWQVVHDEYEKATLKNQKTHEKKKPYFAKINQRVLERRIVTLNNKIIDIDNKLLQINQDFATKKQSIQTEIDQIKKIQEGGI